MLQAAAFYERAGNVVKARERLTGVVAAVGSMGGPLLNFFKDRLLSHLDWFRKPKRSEQELALSDAYFANGDYLRCAIFLYESCVSAASNEATDFPSRDAARPNATGKSKAYRQLRDLRNAMAHGVKSDDWKSWTLAALKSEEALRDELQRLRAALV